MEPTKNLIAILILVSITAATLTTNNISKRQRVNANCASTVPASERPNDCNDKDGKHSLTS